MKLKNIILILFLFFLFSLVAIFLVGYMSERKIQPIKEEKINFQKNSRGIDIFPEEVSIINRDYIFLELKDDKDQNYTEKAIWESSDNSIARVSDTSGTKGQIITGGNSGSVDIIATYDGEVYTRNIQVEESKLKVKCFPLKTTVKIKEDVMWILLYEEMGVPNYTYEWSGDIVSNFAAPEASFDTAGIKNVQIKTVDARGSVAEAQCDPLKVVD